MSSFKGNFITFEGIDGCGKSTQVKMLVEAMNRSDQKTISVREPGGTVISEEIREILLHSHLQDICDRTEALLMTGSRAQLTYELILPNLNAGINVIADRYFDSTLAYQVYGKGVNKNLVDSVHKYILGSIKPDLTFILKVNISKALQRLKERKKKNRYDKFSKNFYEKVQKAFLNIAKTDKKKYIIIDNSLDTPETEKIIFKKFIKVFNK